MKIYCSIKIHFSIINDNLFIIFLFEVPAVISDCTRFIEKHGLVDGIYRVSGVASHIRHLKYEFDSDKRPDLEHMEGLPELSTAYDRTDSNPSLCDPHSVAGLCKLYFR